MKKVEDLFIVDVFRDSKILAGQSGLKRNVESIDVSETPDVANYIAKNSLLVTTGYAFKDNPAALCKLISQLNELPCAGIAIKLKRFIDELPQEVVDLANSLEFPIIQIPLSQTLGNVAHQLLSFLWDNKIEELFYAIHVHRKFTDMMIKGYDLHELIKNLGFFLKSPVLLLNPFGDTISFSQHFHSEHMKKMKDSVEAIFKKDITAFNEINDLTISNPDPKQAPIVLNIFHVKTMQPYPYLLIIFNPEKLPYPSSQLAIEQASTVISFTLLKNEAIKETSRLLENNFFSSLVDGKITSKEEIILRGKDHGLLEKAKYLCIVFKFDKVERDLLLRNDVIMNQSYDFLLDLFNKTEGKIKTNFLLFMKDEYFVFILQPTVTNDDNLKNLIKRNLENFQNDVLEKLKATLSFGIGNMVNDITSIPISYSEALEAWKHGVEIYHHQFINFYETKQLKELIRLIPDDNLKNFYENTLRSLAYPKTKEEVDLVNTMQVFLDNNCEIAMTSKKLFIHRNTVKYRIAKCEEILNYSLQDPQNSLHLRMALLIRPIFAKNE